MGIGKRIQTNQQPTEEKKEARVEEQVFIPTAPKYSFDDIILSDETRLAIERALVIRDHSDLVFKEWGLNETHKHSKKVGINLYGPPGTGKSMAAHAIASHFGRDIILINYADIESKYVGETPKNLTKAFEVAKATNSILFFDEADAILSRRVTNMTNATDTSVNQTRSVMLTLLNEFDGVILFATNYISNFDPAFMRRIVAHVEFKLPNLQERIQLLTKFISPKMPNTIRIYDIANQFEGLSGSDYSNAVLLAAFAGAQSQEKIVQHEHLMTALKGIQSSQIANSGQQVTVETKPVSAEYVKEQFAKGDVTLV